MEKIDWPFEFPGAHWIDDQEEKAALEVIRSKSLFRYYGPQTPTHVADLEAYARQYYGVKYVQATNSCTGALMTSVSALGIGPGDEVIFPTYMWAATLNAIVCHNAIPVLCEVDDSFTMDPGDLESKITRRTKLIIVVHMSGAPANMDRIMQIAAKHNIDVLEDCAQANGGSFKGQKLGTFGTVGTISFQTNKNVTAGEGGLIITNNEELYMKTNAVHDLGVPWINGAPDPNTGFDLWGQGRRMSELCGAVAKVQLQKLPTVIKHMHSSKTRIRQMLSDAPGLAFRRIHDPEGDTGPFMIMILEDEQKAIAVTKKIKDAGLHNAYRLADFGLHIYYNIPSLVNKIPLSPAGNPWSLKENTESNYDYNKGACPQSDALFARSILLPVPSNLTRQQEKAAADIIKEALS